MPSQLPSSFASAAAGQNRDGRGGGRGDATRGSGSGEWTRRDGRSANGTLTFRRPSMTPASQAVHQAGSEGQGALAEGSGASGSGNPLFDAPATFRYSREELLDIFKASPHSNIVDVENLFSPDWNPMHVNGGSARSWGRNQESTHAPQDASICWDASGAVRPIGLETMTAEEKELFASDVNSTLKPPQQNKDGGNQGSGGTNGRKTSISHSSISTFPVSSPSTASRPGTRRRETSDTNPFPNSGLVSPTGTQRFSRDDPSPWFTRKSTENNRDSAVEEPEDDGATSRDTGTKGLPFGGLARNNTSGATGFASIWGSTAAGSSSTSGGFGNFAMANPAADKRFGAGRGESRLAHLIPKDNADGAGVKPSEPQAAPDANRPFRSRPRTDTDPFGDDSGTRGGISALQDSGLPSTSSQPARSHIYETPAKGAAGDLGISGLNLGTLAEGIDTGSPAETNPYRSPPGEHGEDENDEHGPEKPYLGGGVFGSEPPSNFSTLSRGFGGPALEGSDRSQTSSAGAKGFPALSNLTAWPAGPSSGTPDRDRPGFASAFGGALFSPDLQSPSLTNFGGTFGSTAAPGAPVSGSLRGGSKLGSLFPAAMQSQIPGQDPESLGDSVPDLRQANPLGAIGRGTIGGSSQARDAENPPRSARALFDDLFSPTEAARQPASASSAAFTTGEQTQASLTTTLPAQLPGGAAGFPTNQSSTDLPSAQVRTMVMPDRMRWVYLDPQGHVQGPFTGLEMNDWYKANFFTPDLRVKKVEDQEFEPLGQLIRRIGNSREPFLVPQIGIPHGPPPQSGPFSPGDSRSVIPPLVGAFPSYGRTLTAEEQNNLERRKQEEQYLMARQREFLAQQQAMSKMQQMQAMAGGAVPGAGGVLHHHSSAHSLQSQPSYGSITSPIGMQQPPLAALGPGFFDGPPGTTINATQQQPGTLPQSDIFHEDLNSQERQMLANLQGTGNIPAGFPPTQALGAAPGADGGLRSQLPGVDQLQKDSQGFSARLKEFNELRAQRDAEEAAAQSSLAEMAEDQGPSAARLPQERATEVIREVTRVELHETRKGPMATEQSGQALSLTQLVQKTQAAAAAAAAAAVAAATSTAKPESPWAKTQEPGLPMPFPPPQSATPLPAPTAQRGKSTLPDQFSQLGSEASDALPAQGAQAQAAPQLAPWAREPGADPQKNKGPSLKEIQEAEAKKAAKAEEAAAALRRAALEQEAASIREREKAAAAAAAASTGGLPTSSTWGSGTSPVNAGQTASAWAKPGQNKASGAGQGGSAAAAAAAASKKTLADIQREEEARKHKTRELQMQAAINSSSAMGKRYADLASKTGAPPGLANPSGPAPAAPNAAGGSWSTVGPGGKVKIPTGPAAQTRPANASNSKAASAPVIPKQAPKQNPIAKDAGGAAMDEFNKWLHRELSRGLTGGIDVNNVASTLLVLPLDQQIISEVVYSSSTTMDARHFAEEFIRRKKLADKGVVEKSATGGPGLSGDVSTKTGTSTSASRDGGGWSEVAKKGSTGTAGSRDDAPIPGAAGIKVVPSRKKGRK